MFPEQTWFKIIALLNNDKIIESFEIYEPYFCAKISEQMQIRFNLTIMQS